MGLIVILFHLKHTILYCNIYQYFAKRFALFSVNHKNKQTTSGQGKSQVKSKTVYIYELTVLKNP